MKKRKNILITLLVILIIILFAEGITGFILNKTFDNKQCPEPTENIALRNNNNEEYNITYEELPNDIIVHNGYYIIWTFFGILLNFLWLGIPIIIIVIGSIINIIKILIAKKRNNKDKIQKAKKSIKRKFIVSIIIFLSVSIIKSIGYRITEKITEYNKYHYKCLFDINAAGCGILSSDKPIIYIYPTTDIEMTVKLGNKDYITVSYPKYIDEWKVLAKPNGDLIDLDTGRKLYSLYYENTNVINFDGKEDGFVVKGEDSAQFLEEKLEILGLNEREAEEFIIYWLPKLEANKFNYIRFATMDEINQNMPLEFSTNPDTLIRVLMTFKGLDKPIEVKEQTLNKVIRRGFTIVEWGGSEIK